jgi:hypothetical protein
MGGGEERRGALAGGLGGSAAGFVGLGGAGGDKLGGESVGPWQGRSLLVPAPLWLRQRLFQCASYGPALLWLWGSPVVSACVGQREPYRHKFCIFPSSASFRLCFRRSARRPLACTSLVSIPFNPATIRGGSSSFERNIATPPCMPITGPSLQTADRTIERRRVPMKERVQL